MALMHQTGAPARPRSRQTRSEQVKATTGRRSNPIATGLGPPSSRRLALERPRSRYIFYHGLLGISGISSELASGSGSRPPGNPVEQTWSAGGRVRLVCNLNSFLIL